MDKNVDGSEEDFDMSHEKFFKHFAYSLCEDCGKKWTEDDYGDLIEE